MLAVRDDLQKLFGEPETKGIFYLKQVYYFPKTQNNLFSQKFKVSTLIVIITKILRNEKKRYILFEASILFS